MLTALIAAFVVNAVQGVPLACPVQGDEATKNIAATDYRGVRYYYCCGGCNRQFEKSPMTYIGSAENKGKTIGESLFDPVSGQRVAEDKVKARTDYEGVRFVFSSEANKAVFIADPKKFANVPEKEVLFCAVQGHEIKNYDEAGGYVDAGSVRYYVCCGDCLAKMKSSSSEFVDKVQDKVQTPKPFSVKAKA